MGTVVPETVLACGTQTSKGTSEHGGDIGLVVDIAVRIAADMVAYHIVGRSGLLPPGDQAGGLLK